MTLKHQSVTGALLLVRPHLSERGTVELQPGANTLVVRDTPDAVRAIGSVIRDFDHPPREVRVQMQFLRATKTVFSPAIVSSELPEDLVERLDELLSFNNYELLAQSSFSTREGEPVAYRVGREFETRFRVGTILASRRLRLEEFRVMRKTEEEEEPRRLIHVNLDLRLGQPIVLVIARSESSHSVIVVAITCSQTE